MIKSLKIFAFLENRQIRPEGGAGRQHPQSIAIRYFLEDEEASRFAHHLDLIARFQRRQTRAQLAFRDGDQIELEIGIAGGVDVGVGALHAFAVDFQPELGKLPGGKRMNRRPHV